MVTQATLQRLRLIRCVSLTGIVAVGSLAAWLSLPTRPDAPPAEVHCVMFQVDQAPAEPDDLGTDEYGQERSEARLSYARERVAEGRLGAAARALDSAVDWDPSNEAAHALRRDVEAMLEAQAAERRTAKSTGVSR